MGTQTTLRNNRVCLVGEFGHVAAAAARFARSSHTDEGGGSDRGDRGRDARNDSSSGGERTERGRRKVTTAENEDDTAQRRRKRGEKKSSRNTTGGEISLSPGFYFAIFFFPEISPRARIVFISRALCGVRRVHAYAAFLPRRRGSHAPAGQRTDGRTVGRPADLPSFQFFFSSPYVCVCVYAGATRAFPRFDFVGFYAHQRCR